jgi:hypothetical protein
MVYRTRSLQKSSNYFTLNLAFADILVSLVNMPVTIYTILQQRWLLGEDICRVLGYVNILSFISSVMSLALIAINRLFFVVHWKKYTRYFSPRRVKMFIALNWILSGLLSLPPLIGWSSFGYVPGKSYCFVLWRDDVYFAYFMVVVCFFGPLVTMGICYTKILLFTRHAKRKIKCTNSAIAGPTKSMLFRNVSPEEARITNTFLIVLGVFIICWSPFATTMFFDIYNPNTLPRWIDVGSLLLGYMNSLCNPIIYSVRNRKFRGAFFELCSHFVIPCLKRNANDSSAHHKTDAQRQPGVAL